MRLPIRLTPPQIFSAVSLVLIAVMVVTASLVESAFYRRAIIERETLTVREAVSAIVEREQEEHGLSSSDMGHYRDPGAQSRLRLAFITLTHVFGVGRIKVFNKNADIVWSDQDALVGKQLTSHPDLVARALSGETSAVYDAADRSLNAMEGLPQIPLIEFYVPLTIKGDTGAPPAAAAVALYRYPQQLDKTIRDGIFRLSLVTGGSGLLLFAALYALFRSVYRRKVEAESEFAKFSTEHEKIVQIEKLSAVGQMVSEIAHQLNNPLVGVINLAQLAERELTDHPHARELLAEVRSAGEHCRTFVQRMLKFNELSRSEIRPTEMGSLVRDTIAFFRLSMAGHPEVRLEAADRPLVLEVDPVLVRHALFNIIHNAAQAAPESAVEVSFAPEERSGVPGCTVRVSDRGPGIRPEIADKLFTPFFTTRPQGTGLGLTVAQHIALRHGGKLQAGNKPEGGALFTLWLPGMAKA